MRRIRRITIVGLGLIGGSIGLAVKGKGLAGEVIGVARRKGSILSALRRGAIDKGTLDLNEGVSSSELVAIATDVGAIPGIVRESANFMKKGGIIFDVGSVKKEIVLSSERSLPRGVSFVGCHPMAGSEKSGIENAEPNLFEGALVILTPTRHTDKVSLKTIKSFWQALGANTTIMDVELHDRIVAMISHLVHIAAFGLCLVQNEDTIRYAASGFKDTTRVASSDADIWTDIFESNRRYIIPALDRFLKELSNIREDMKEGNFEKIRRKLMKAKLIRESIV